MGGKLRFDNVVMMRPSSKRMVAFYEELGYPSCERLSQVDALHCPLTLQRIPHQQVNIDKHSP